MGAQRKGERGNIWKEYNNVYLHIFKNKTFQSLFNDLHDEVRQNAIIFTLKY